jgi:GntR family transcriptional regulator/MocR family aminotransferase
MDTRSFTLSLPDDGGPLFARIAAALADDIRRGRLRAGDALPGSRSLAASLGVHRNTVLEAYGDLEAQGWIRTEPARGTFVAPSVDVTWVEKQQAKPTSGGIGFALAPAPHLPPDDPILPPGCLALFGGAPDLRLLPTAELSRAWRRALTRHAPTLLAYGDPRGEPALRRALTALLAARRGLARGEDEILVTRGSQMGLSLAAKALLEPGDAVAVESWGYAPAWSAFRAAGARLVPVGVDGEGLVVDELVAQAARERIRAVYVTPHHQYPTTAVLSAERRMKLLSFAREKRIAVIEDDYDHEFHYEGRPVLPLAASDEHGVVIYVGTLSKILAPGLRTGFVVGPRALIDRLAALRKHVDRQGDRVGERALAELLDDGIVERHARRMSRTYRARRDHLAALLRSELPDVLQFDVPRGGMAFWAHCSVDADAWLARCIRQGVAFHAGSRFALDGQPRAFARIGFASLDEAELDEAVRRMKAAL